MAGAQAHPCVRAPRVCAVPAPFRLHYGEVSLQIIKRTLHEMKPKESTQMVPQYTHTRDDAPEDTNVCYEAAAGTATPATGAPQAKCAGAACRQLKLRPASLLLQEERWVVSPISTFIGVLGGVMGLGMYILLKFHDCLVVCGRHKGICAPTVTAENRQAAAALLDAVGWTASGKPDGRQQLPMSPLQVHVRPKGGA